MPMKMDCLTLLLAIMWTFSGAKTHNGNNTYVALYQITAVKSGKASLPCDISPPRGDAVSMVIWYKSDRDTPIYTFDSRGKDLPVHFPDETVLGPRAFFKESLKPAVLTIQSIRESDAGLYRCRVDFRKSKTKNFLHNVTVIIPPASIRITDERNQEIAGTTAPYPDGGEMTLLCSATGGYPPPQLYWWQDNTVLDTSYFSPSPGVYQNFLNITKLSRMDMKSQFTCTADNTNMTSPLTRSVVVDMLLPPSQVRIIPQYETMVAGRTAKITCLISGSRPAPSVTWILNGQVLSVPELSEVIDDGESLRSSISYTPLPLDDGKRLICRAANHRVSNADWLEDAMMLQVEYPPFLEIKLGRGIQPNKVKEGDDVYFECDVNANPEPNMITWQKNGEPISHNVASSYLVTRHSLVVRQITRKASGNYTCQAANSHGERTSAPHQLSVLGAPVCSSWQPLTYTAAKMETVYIPCVLESNPPATKFRWHFNGTAQFTDLSISQFKISSLEEIRDKSLLSTLLALNLTKGSFENHGISVLKVHPNTSQDFGFLYCLGSNEVGNMREPCVFNFLESEIPHPPENCTLKNQTGSSIDVECNEAFDGNLQQSFLLEIIDIQRNEVIANISSRVPEFSFLLDGQTSSVRSYRVSSVDSHLSIINSSVLCRVYSYNKLGKSDPVVLETIVMRPMEEPSGLSGEDNFLATLGVVAGLAVVIVALTLGLVFGLRRRRRPEEKSAARTLEVYQNGSTVKTSLSTKSMDGGFQEYMQRDEEKSLGSDSALSPFGNGPAINAGYNAVTLGRRPHCYGDHTVLLDHQFSTLPRTYLPVPEGRSDGPDLIHHEIHAIRLRNDVIPELAEPLQMTTRWENSDLL